MKVLIVKISSMGDIIHTLPALEDASKNFPNVEFDWVVEPGFAEIPAWHKSINKIIKMPLRKWRKNFLKYIVSGEIIATIKQLRAEKYDKIIDAQGLFKSALICMVAKGKTFGFDYSSAREAAASIFYQKKFKVSITKHAVTRSRELFAKALNYSFNYDNVEYGLDLEKIKSKPDQLINNLQASYVIFFHGTTWDTKHWPRSYWHELAKLVVAKNMDIFVTSATAKQLEFVKEFSKLSLKIHILPMMNIAQAAKLIANSTAVVGVDTGFCHLAAALDKYTISIFGPTDPNKSRPLGQNQKYFHDTKLPCSPCFDKICKYNREEVNKAFPPCFTNSTPRLILSELEKNKIFSDVNP